MGLQPHYIAKKEMIEINEQTTTKVEYPKSTQFRMRKGVKMDLNQWTREIHELAVLKGRWEKPRTFAEIIALCHSELSEALEEYRNGHGLNEIYYSDGAKPEGIPIELADMVIRILDYLEHQGVDIQQVINEFEPWIPKEINKTNTLPKLIAGCHWLLSESYWHKTISKLDRDLFSQRMLIHVILTIQKFCQKNNIDLEKAIQIKYEYNKNRPCRNRQGDRREGR